MLITLKQIGSVLIDSYTTEINNAELKNHGSDEIALQIIGKMRTEDNTDVA